MADDADRAQQRIEADLEAAISAARGILPLETQSANECGECGELIPSNRQIAVPGCQFCVTCAAAIERRQAMYRVR